jgi:hypothetical protein
MYSKEIMTYKLGTSPGDFKIHRAVVFNTDQIACIEGIPSNMTHKKIIMSSGHEYIVHLDHILAIYGLTPEEILAKDKK